MFRGEPPTPSAFDDIAVGRFRIRVVYRQNDIDEGITVHVFGPVGGRDEEVLRFDCFRAQPHYHLAWSYREAPFVPIAEPDSFGWTLDQLVTRFDALLAEAGGDPLTPEEHAALPHALRRLKRRGDQIARSSA